MERRHKVIDIPLPWKVTVETHVNAPLAVIVKLLTPTKELRYIKDQDTGDVYIFDAFNVTHAQMAEAIAVALGRGRRKLLVDGANAGLITVGGEDTPTVVDRIGRSYTVGYVLPHAEAVDW